MRKFANTLLVLAVCLTIAIPAFCINLKPDQISVTENRTLAQPNWDSGINGFMKSVSASIDDRIGLREAMMNLYTKVMFTTLNANHSDVIVGEDGWLFYNGDIPDYSGSNNTDEIVAHQIEVLTAIDAWCKERDITFILAVGPNKSAVYDNCMPAGIYQAEQSKAQRITELLREQGIHASYTKDEMLLHRDETELYYKLDTHWNSYGARFMMEDMLTQLGLPIREFTYIPTPVIEGDLMNMMGTGYNGVYSLQVESELAPNARLEELAGTSHIYIHSENTEKIVCYRDSFHRVMLPFYTYYFHGNVFWDFNIDFDFVEQEAPKYLILSCVERFFDDMIRANEDILNS